MSRSERRVTSRTAAALAAATLLAQVACGGISVRTDFDPGTDFSGYSTFAVLGQPPDQTTLDRFWEARVQNAIVPDLESKGFTRVEDAGRADLAIGFQLTTEERSSFQTVNTGWGGYGYGYGGGWYGPGWGGGISTSNTTETRYEVGQLVVAMFDTSKDEMVFISTGSGTLDQRQRTPEESQARADDVIWEILKDFPPGS